MYVNPLNRARIGSGIAVSEVAARTCLSPRIVQLIDAGAFDRLPGGLYARSYIRAFAAVVGLDAEDVIRQVADRLPPDEDPLPMLRENARASLPPFVKELSRRADQAKAFLASRLGHLRPPSLRAGEQSRRMAAVTLDVALIGLFYASLLRATAWTAGVAVHEALEFAAFPVAALSVLVGLLYFVILGGIGGRTPGAAACRLRPSTGGSPLSLRTICLRAMSFPAEGSAPQAAWDADAHWQFACREER